MRSWVSFAALAVLALAAATAQADELTFTLDSYIGYGSATNLDPDPNSCLPPNCVLFTGTLTDNDVDLQPDNNPSYLSISTPYTDASDMVTFDGVLSLDNIAPTGILSGDTEWATDGLLNPPNTYPDTYPDSGPIFGIDIPAGTPEGVYTDTVYLDITPTNGNDPFTVSATVTVIIPEPAAAGLMLGGLAALAGLSGVKRGVKRLWPFFEASR
jgi:hypothetical protein